MKKIIVFLLSLTIAFMPTLVLAGAAEKWEYDVTPNSNQQLDIKGHKVDQYGKAVNDNVYKTSIDTKAASPRSKMGAVGMGRLLKGLGWSFLGAAALQGLLEAVDWVIDPATQSIWRYKKTGDVGFGCKNFGYKWKASTNVYNCPIDAFPQFNICKTNTNAKNCLVKELWADQGHTVKVSSLSESAIPPFIDIEVSFSYNNTPDTNYIRVHKDEKIVEPPKEKEQITPEQVADYANHTHPDFADPDLAPKLNPKWNPNIAPDLFRPGNQWEKDNSPTVKEVESQLDKTQPTSNDTGIKPNPTPDNPNPVGGFDLPNFCDWANTVCDHITWSQEQPDLDTPETDIKTPTPFDTSIFTKDRFQVSRQCPVPEQHTINLSGVSVNFAFDLKPICTVFEMARPALIACSYLYAAYIVIGASKNG